MANPAHQSILLRSILLEYQMMVDEVFLRERKDLTTTLNTETGLKEIHLTHTRFIGEKSYTSKQSFTDGEKGEEVIETAMDHSELENFKIYWEEKWNGNLSIPQDESGPLTKFFYFPFA